MTDTLPNSRNWAARLNGALWLALILFALAGLLVMRDLPAWMIALIVAANAAACRLPNPPGRRRSVRVRPAYREGAGPRAPQLDRLEQMQ